MSEDAVPAQPKYAFRCNNCQNLVPAEHAGESEVPHACPNCGKGVEHYIDEGGNIGKRLHPENWTVLHGLDPAELAPILEYHAITTDDIEQHVPPAVKTENPNPKIHEVSADDTSASADRAGGKA